MIPLISSISFGPIGVCHIPRFWWKVILRAQGLLDEDYPDFSGGLDRMVLETLELNSDQVLSHLRTERPSYLDFEKWILDQKGGALDAETVSEWNATIRNREHGEAKLADIHGTLGTPNDGSLISAVILNQLEDWHFFHQRDLPDNLDVFGKNGIPLISTIDYGRLRITQLPRTWLKVILRAKGILHEDYHDAGRGLDGAVVQVLKLDEEEMLGYLRTNIPSYQEFENWVEERMNPGDGAIEHFNNANTARQHRDERRVETLAGINVPDDGTLRSAMVLNRIEDWTLAYNQIFT